MLINLLQAKKKYNMKIEGVIQIGGHYGQEFDILKEIGANEILIFEPSPIAFSVLEKRLNKKAILIEKAVGNENKKVQMNVETVNKGMSNSILEPHLHLSKHPNIKFEKKIEVDMIRLDDFIKGNNYNFLVIDVQGYELEVLKGSCELLRFINYIVIEVNHDELYKGGPLVEDIDRFLGKYFFKRVETNWMTINGWGDALYIKQFHNKLI